MSEEARRNNSLAQKGRVPWNKGLKAERDLRVQQYVRKGALIRKQRIQSGELPNPSKNFGKIEKPWNKGKRYSLTHSGQFKKGQRPWNLGKTGYHFESIHCAEKHRAARLRQVFPVKDSKPEREFQEFLNKYNVMYLKHYPILGQPDIVIPERKLAIFIDGCWWHGCKLHYPVLNERQILQSERDIRIKAKLESDGWTVLRVWEHDVMNKKESKLAAMLGVW